MQVWTDKPPTAADLRGKVYDFLKNNRRANRAKYIGYNVITNTKIIFSDRFERYRYQKKINQSTAWTRGFEPCAEPHTRRSLRCVQLLVLKNKIFLMNSVEYNEMISRIYRLL